MDNERILPGITKVFKLGEDFPFIDNHSLNKEKEGYKNFHQQAFVYCDIQEIGANSLISFMRNLPNKKVELTNFTDLHHMRYAFVHNIFQAYNLLPTKIE